MVMSPIEQASEQVAKLTNLYTNARDATKRAGYKTALAAATKSLTALIAAEERVAHRDFVKAQADDVAESAKLKAQETAKLAQELLNDKAESEERVEASKSQRKIAETSNDSRVKINEKQAHQGRVERDTNRHQVQSIVSGTSALGKDAVNVIAGLNTVDGAIDRQNDFTERLVGGMSPDIAEPGARVLVAAIRDGNSSLARSQALNLRGVIEGKRADQSRETQKEAIEAITKAMGVITTQLSSKMVKGRARKDLLAQNAELAKHLAEMLHH